MIYSLKRFRFMVAILAITAFIPTVKTGFMWDDHVMIESNPWIQSWSVQNVVHDFTHDVFEGHGDAYYRPLQTLSNRINYSFSGLQPLAYHATNLLFHIGNALLVLELILALGFTLLTAFLTASLFAVHPIIVEQLMIIAGRAELMGLFFLLTSLLLFLKKEKGTQVGAWAAYIAALFCKESSVLLPAALGLVYYVRKEPIPYKRIVALLATIVPYLILRRMAIGPMASSPDIWLAVRFFFQEFPSVIVRYIGLLLCPWNLHSHRLLPHLSHFWGLYLAGVAGLSYFLIKRYGRAGFFCVAWFILMLLPKTPVMIYGNFMLDHWAYPASIAIFLPLALLVAWGWNSRKNSVRLATALLYFVVLIVWSLLAHLNVELRGTDEKMYRWALRSTSSNPIKYNLGVLLLEKGRAEEAIPYFEEVLDAYPDDANATYALAKAYWITGHRKTSLSILQRFCARHPENHHLQYLLKNLRAAR